MATDTRPPREVFIELVSSYLGLREEGGDNLGTQIIEFQKAVDSIASREPWCICFLQYCGLKTQEITGHKWLPYRTESALLMWEKTPKEYRRALPEPGLIALWRLTGTRRGHGGAVIALLDGNGFETIEGNTSPGPGVKERNGDGVYSKRLFMPAQRGKMKLLGFLLPFV